MLSSRPGRTCLGCTASPFIRLEKLKFPSTFHKIGRHKTFAKLKGGIYLVSPWHLDFCPSLTFTGLLGPSFTFQETRRTYQNLSFQVRQNVPRVSYVSLLDIWMLSCMIFVFSCILEFIVVTVHIRSGKKALGERVRCIKSNYMCVWKFALSLANVTTNPNLSIQSRFL